MFEYIYSCYEKELEAKKCVVENIARCINDNEVVMYIVAWLYQINITNLIFMQIHAMIKETNHVEPSFM